MVDKVDAQSLTAAIISEWADQGRLIEGGWMAYVAISGLENASYLQRTEMRKAYMLGAQHLFSSIIGIMGPGAEPTDRELRCLALIEQELGEFIRSVNTN